VRSITISGPAPAVFAQVNDFHNWANNFTAKAIHLFINMDNMIGGQFEKGLAAMKSIVEKTLKQ
jgi:hypothetical protein